MMFVFWFLIVVLVFVFMTALLSSVSTTRSREDRIINLIVSVVVFILLTIMDTKWWW